MNWTRKQLKDNAKLMVKKNYGLCILVTLLITLLAGTGGNVNPSGLNLNVQDSDAIGQSIASGFGGGWSAYVLRFLPLAGLVAGSVVILSILFRLLVGNVLTVGGARFFLHNIHSQGEFNDLAFGFKNQFGNVVLVMFRKELSEFLWSLLLIIPGIYRAYQLYLVPYLLADNPEMSWEEASLLSKSMMDGEKINTFVLELSFIGWEFLSAFTLGLVGLLWVNPWRQATTAELYTAIKARYTGESF